MSIAVSRNVLRKRDRDQSEFDIHPMENSRALRKKLERIVSILLKTGSVSMEEREVWRPFALQLLDEWFLSHPDSVIKILVALSHSHFLLILSADLPYSHEEVMDILMFAVNQLDHLREATTSPAYELCNHLFFFLVTNKIFHLAFVFGEDELLQNFCSSLVHQVLKITRINHEDILEKGALELLISFINKMISKIGMSRNCLGKLLMYLIEPYSSRYQNSRRIVIHIILKCRSSLEGCIHKLLVHDLTRDDGNQKVFSLIFSLHEICCDMLLGVINTLEHCLLSEGKKKFRACSLLMKMFSAPDSLLAHDYRRLWNIFMLICDWDADVPLMQMILLKHASDLLVNQPLLRSDFTRLLEVLSSDPDSDIRIRVVSCIAKAAKDIPSLLNDHALLSIIEKRTNDVEVVVRNCAQTALKLPRETTPYT